MDLDELLIACWWQGELTGLDPLSGRLRVRGI
jgi:hypothetical protein